MSSSPSSRPTSETRLSLSHIVPETDEDRRRLREAEIRRSHRLARRAAIIASHEEAAHEEAAHGEAAVGEAAGGGGGR